MDEHFYRIECLKLAMALGAGDDSAAVESAEKLFAFVGGGQTASGPEQWRERLEPGS